MTNIGHIPDNTLTVDVEEIPILFVPKNINIVVRHNMGVIYLFIGKKSVELSTITAHGIGMAIAKSKLAPNELIVLAINKERIELLWAVAKKVSTALLRKADDADDWQLQNRRILT